MKSLGLGFCLGILLSCLGSSYSSGYIRCFDKAQRRCFKEIGLKAHSKTGEIQNVIEQDPSTLCGNLGRYESALRCALNEAKDCARQFGVNATRLPEEDSIKRSVSNLCDNIDNVNATCVKEAQKMMKECALSKTVISDDSDNPGITYSARTCRYFQSKLDCLREKLDHCGRQTKDIFVELFQVHHVPLPCTSASRTRRAATRAADKGYRFTTIAPLTVASLVTVIPRLPRVTCHTQTSIQSSQKQCFENEGIAINLPQINLQNGMEAKQSYLDAVLSNNRDIREVCRELPKYYRAMGCAMEVARYCMPSGYKDYLPGTHNVQKMLRELCLNVDVINQVCVTSKASALFDCGYQKGKEHPSTDVKALLCNAFKWNVACQKEILPPCGCRTTALYVKIAKEYLNPPACSRIQESSPVCIAGSDRFASGSSTVSVLSSTSLLLLATFAIWLALGKF